MGTRFKSPLDQTTCHRSNLHSALTSGWVPNTSKQDFSKRVTICKPNFKLVLRWSLQLSLPSWRRGIIVSNQRLFFSRVTFLTQFQLAAGTPGSSDTPGSSGPLQFRRRNRERFSTIEASRDRGCTFWGGAKVSDRLRSSTIVEHKRCRSGCANECLRSHGSGEVLSSTC